MSRVAGRRYCARPFIDPGFLTPIVVSIKPCLPLVLSLRFDFWLLATLLTFYALVHVPYPFPERRCLRFCVLFCRGPLSPRHPWRRERCGRQRVAAICEAAKRVDSIRLRVRSVACCTTRPRFGSRPLRHRRDAEAAEKA